MTLTPGDPPGITGVVPAGERWQRWKTLNNDGARLLDTGDVDGGATMLEAAYRETLVADVDTEGLARRAATLVNLAGPVEARGDPGTAADLIGTAIELTHEVERTVGDHFSTVALRANAYATRAQIFLRTGRYDDGFDDVRDGLDAAAAADSQRELIVITLRNVGTGLLMATGRLAEAEQEALAAADLALAHHPRLAAFPYTNLALIAEAVGDVEAAEGYRLLAEHPGPVLPADTGPPGSGPRPVGPRWRSCVELNLRGAELARTGDHRGASVAFDEAYRETLAGDDVEALVCRSAVAGNQAGLAAHRGDFDRALRSSTEAIELSREVEALVGPVYGTTADRVSAYLTRAQYLRHMARFDAAIADLDEAAGALQDVTENEAQLAVSLHTVRASVLVAAARFEDGAAAARTALDLAQEAAPHLAAYAQLSLAEVAEATGDMAASTDHLQHARELFAAAGDTTGEAAAAHSLGRRAHLDGRQDDADEFYEAAEALFTRAGHALQLVTCRHARAAIAVVRGRPHDALGMLDEVLTSLGPDAAPVALVATYQVQGSAFEAIGAYDRADERYLAAREVSEQAGLWHAVLGTDWWRADALARWSAAVTDPGERLALQRRSLDVALPVALAAEAVRRHFGAGPMRERWVALAVAPATRAAMSAIAALGDVGLAAAFIDHTSSAVSMEVEQRQPSAVSVAERGEVLSLPLPAGEAGDAALPLAAVGGPVEGSAASPFPAIRLGAAPRVRVDPAVPGPLDAWIDVAEERYGLMVRSSETVRSW